MRRKIHKCLSFLLAAVLLASLAAPAALAAEGGDTVFVRTAEDLVQLAENCTLDSWSQGRIVRLEADIDLSGTDFTPIPTFGGTFEGQGHTISGLDAQGNEVFSHTYHKLDEENENGFLFYQSDDADSGDFTYFAFSPDTMETTYHLEFRYAEDLSDLQSWFEGNYAYWNAAAIAVDYDQETMKNVIELFVTENLTEAE